LGNEKPIDRVSQEDSKGERGPVMNVQRGILLPFEKVKRRMYHPNPKGKSRKALHKVDFLPKN